VLLLLSLLTSRVAHSSRLLLSLLVAFLLDFFIAGFFIAGGLHLVKALRKTGAR
jgi:hypothetical protein